jgi:hypothetical protein
MAAAQLMAGAGTRSAGRPTSPRVPRPCALARSASAETFVLGGVAASSGSGVFLSGGVSSSGLSAFGGIDSAERGASGTNGGGSTSFGGAAGSRRIGGDSGTAGGSAGEAARAVDVSIAVGRLVSDGRPPGFDEAIGAGCRTVGTPTGLGGDSLVIETSSTAPGTGAALRSVTHTTPARRAPWRTQDAVNGTRRATVRSRSVIGAVTRAACPRSPEPGARTARPSQPRAGSRPPGSAAPYP